MSCNRTGGCDFAIDPRLSADRAPIFWSPRIDPAVVLLSAMPACVDTDAAGISSVVVGPIRKAPEGTHVLYSADGASTHVVLLEPADPEKPLSAIIPLDARVPDRLFAVSRFWMAVCNLPAPDDGRLTKQRRSRLVRMLRAFDGRHESASYREIAEVLLRAPPMSAREWKTHSLRNQARRLVADATALVNGGYLKLLHRR